MLLSMVIIRSGNLTYPMGIVNTAVRIIKAAGPLRLRSWVVDIGQAASDG
jgi:hypothetical protein